MCTLQWRSELLRIAKEYKILPCLRDRKYVYKRHLPSFIDEQNVNAVFECLVRPQPGSPASHLSLA